MSDHVVWKGQNDGCVHVAFAEQAFLSDSIMDTVKREILREIVSMIAVKLKPQVMEKLDLEQLVNSSVASVQTEINREVLSELGRIRRRL